ncbi:MAG: permease [Firmicutes bacterium]|nr:permease [Candidatus Fermentithermobacillaceae bacterium]
MKKAAQKYGSVVLVIIANVALWCFSPSAGTKSTAIAMNVFKEMLLILPPVFLLLGLLNVWVPREVIERYMGRGSGIKGALVSMFLGSTLGGPLYAAFPVAAALLAKGARVSNVVTFLTVKAAAEIPLVAVEIRFLGLPFALWRLGLTLAAAVAIGLLVERKVEAPHPRS